MKFIKLEILNLASLDRQGGETISFEEGALGECTIFSIVGPTGSGKSTILDAICLALYGRTPRYPRKKGDRNQNIEIYGAADDGEKSRLAPTDSRNILTRGKKDGYSKLTFLANNGTVYRAEWNVHMKVKSYDATTALYKITVGDGRQIEEEAEWNELPEIIGLEYEQFLRTVLIAQGSFANFVTAKEDERYELLEKLIGCGKLYTTIALRIKEQKEKSDEAYNTIAANFSAQMRDMISDEEELSKLKARIEELEVLEQKAKEELAAVAKAIEWYVADEKFDENIAKFKKNFDEALQRLEGMKERVALLELHDSTLPAVNHYKDMKRAEKGVATCGDKLKLIDEDIKSKELKIKEETDVELKRLTTIAQEKADALEQQRPHINKARQIKTELKTLTSVLAEKERARSDAERAKSSADNDLTDNEKKIADAEKSYRKVQQERDDLKQRIESRVAEVRLKVEKATSDYNSENAKLQNDDAAALQKAKTEAEREQNDLNNAIRIRDDIGRQLATQQEKQTLQDGLNKRNAEIEEKLKGFNIDALNAELETLKSSFTLMTSEKWEEHRSRLVDGEACPLCGATHHPYHDAKSVATVIDDMKILIDGKEKRLKEDREEKQKLDLELSGNKGELKAIVDTLKSLSANLVNLEEQWREIDNRRESWPREVEALRGMLPEAERRVADATAKLDDHNALDKRVNKLRKAKESAEGEQQLLLQSSTVDTQNMERKVNDANTLLETEKGKRDNLIKQQQEKADALTKATAERDAAKKDVDEKSDELKSEIGDKDPDTLEKELTDGRDCAEKDVQNKKDAISRLNEELNDVRGQRKATEEHRQREEDNAAKSRDELSKWLSTYNDGRSEQLTDADIAELYSSTENWEEIRLMQRGALENKTSAETTLNNETKAREAHQEQKPEAQKEELLARKMELEARSNSELIDLKARLKRHEDAELQMGPMKEQKERAEKLKREWEEITAAIGGDGKTLRKIAQCYTLRFLIEHANVEIRRFNSRYELQHVKNSLGIRVIDHDRADDVRDTTSLSGGEMFIVSLGLALGLSSISSRNISFGNLFIDEGFGTLDPDTLATVIDSLAMLQSAQGKKVGVISHTDTMSERITTQIRIIKNGHSGSSHIEIYP